MALLRQPIAVLPVGAFGGFDLEPALAAQQAYEAAYRVPLPACGFDDCSYRCALGALHHGDHFRLLAAARFDLDTTRPRVQTDATASRRSKKAAVIAMMKRAKGVTLEEIIGTTGWQRHTVRGFVSILGRKIREKIESSKNAAGSRTYRIVK